MNILTKIKLIKHQCQEHKHGCNNCPDLLPKGKCRVKEVAYLLCRNPSDWDDEQIEKWLNA